MKTLNRTLLTAALTAFILPVTMQAQSINWPDVKPPVAEKKEYVRNIHGDKVEDPYYWMIDFFKKGPDSANVISYLQAENNYLESMMKETEPLQEKLFDEMKARIKEKDESVPVFKNGYYYYTRTEEGKQYFKYCRKKGSLTAKEEVLLDVDKMAEGYPYFSAVGFQVSPDNKLLAYGVDTVSRRQYFIRVKDLATGRIYKEAIPNTTGSVAWANDNKTFFYTAKNPTTLLSEKIKRHTLGADPATDPVVYYETDNTNYIGVERSKNGKFIRIISGGTMSSDVRFLDASKPAAAFKVFQPRMKDVLYDITPLDNKFLIITNLDAKNFRLMEAPLDKPGKENWKDVIAHRSDVLLEGVEEFKNFLVISERQNGLVQLRVRRLDNGNEHYLNFGEAAYAANVGGNPEYNSVTLRYNYTSMTTPASVYDYHMVSKDKKLMKRTEVLGGYDSEEYVTERVYATARDGVKVPVSIVYKKGYKKDGTQPLLLYAYGSYGNSIDATFSSTRLSLLNRGFAFAIAHIRGGQEMGRQWYEEGKMMKKKNTFTDFIDVGKYLVDEKYTDKKHLYAQGGSAGGLLMGAVINLEPELFNGVIAQVPFVDVVNTMMDASIPLTTNEYDEWGNPENADAYHYMKSYSPYENIEKKKYPNLLVTTGLHDSQVQYFEPAKWVAKLRDMKKGDNVVLLQTNMKFGHGGASGRFDYLKDIALNYAFLFALEGIKE